MCPGLPVPRRLSRATQQGRRRPCLYHGPVSFREIVAGGPRTHLDSKTSVRRARPAIRGAAQADCGTDRLRRETDQRMQTRSFKHARILIIDDEPANVELLQRLLERAGFANLEATTEPRQAAELYVRHRPDLILLDLHMPGMDGLAVMDQLNEIAEASYL